MHTFSLVAAESDKIAIGGMTTLLGLGMTFLVLVLIILSICLLRLVLKMLDKYLPTIKTSIKNLFRKKNSDIESRQATPNSDINHLNNTTISEIDDDTKYLIEQSIRQYIKNTSNDEKPHDNIKIISIKEETDE